MTEERQTKVLHGPEWTSTHFITDVLWAGREYHSQKKLLGCTLVAGPLRAWVYLKAAFKESQAGGAAGVVMALLLV